MNRRVLIGVALALVAIAIAGTIGAVSYQAGVAHGLAESGTVLPPEGGVPHAAHWPYRPFWHHGPFGFFGIIFPLLFLFLLFGLLRRVLWGPWWAGPGHRWTGGVPPMFEEWHRRAHEPPSGDPGRSA